MPSSSVYQSSAFREEPTAVAPHAHALCAAGSPAPRSGSGALAVDGPTRRAWNRVPPSVLRPSGSDLRCASTNRQDARGCAARADRNVTYRRRPGAASISRGLRQPSWANWLTSVGGTWYTGQDHADRRAASLAPRCGRSATGTCLAAPEFFHRTLFIDA